MSNYRMVRIGLLIAVVAGGILFHHQGHAYDVMRGVYFVIVIGFLVWRFALRRGGRSPGNRNRSRGQYESGGPYNSSSSGPPTPGPHSFGGPGDSDPPPSTPTSQPPPPAGL